MKQKIYISSTFLDLKEYRSLIKSLFENQLANAFELCGMMDRKPISFSNHLETVISVYATNKSLYIIFSKGFTICEETIS
jgi:hypothetical protein